MIIDSKESNKDSSCFKYKKNEVYLNKSVPVLTIS